MTIPVFPFPANWAQAISERLEWLTAIQTSPIGAEQRQALRVGPRRFLDYPILVIGQERTYFDVMMSRYSGGQWRVPVPHEAVFCGPSVAGSTTFSIDTKNREFRLGGFVQIQDSSFRYDCLEVTSIGAAGIVTTPTTNSYPHGCMVTPTFLGVISEKVTVNRQTSRAFDGTVRFVSQEPTLWPPPTYSPEFEPFFASAGGSSSYPVLTREPNGITALPYDYDRMWNVVDNQMSQPVYTDRAKRLFNSQRYEFFLVGRQEQADFRDFMFFLKGRWRPCWVPSFNEDLANGYAPNPLHDLTTLPGGRAYTLFVDPSGVVNFLPVSGDSSASGVAPENYPAFFNSFVSLKRLDVDSLEFVHHGGVDGVMTCSVLFKDAPDLRTPGGFYQIGYTGTELIDPTPPTTSITLPPPTPVGGPITVTY